MNYFLPVPKVGPIKMKQKGFTLIEMLVVVLIIMLLATMVLVQASYARQKSRDLQRIADLTRVAGALENYYADNSATGYPTGTFDPVVSTLVTNQYLESGVTNPYPDSSYSTNVEVYSRTDANNYRLYFQVEIPANASCSENVACAGHGNLYLIKNGKVSKNW